MQSPQFLQTHTSYCRKYSSFLFISHLLCRDSGQLCSLQRLSPCLRKPTLHSLLWSTSSQGKSAVLPCSSSADSFRSSFLMKGSAKVFSTQTYFPSHPSMQVQQFSSILTMAMFLFMRLVKSLMTTSLIFLSFSYCSIFSNWPKVRLTLSQMRVQYLFLSLSCFWQALQSFRGSSSMFYQGWVLIFILDRKLRKSLPFEITSAQLYSLEFRAFQCFTIVMNADLSGLRSVLTTSVPFRSTKLPSCIFPLSKILSFTFKVLSTLCAKTGSFNLMGLLYTNLQISQIKRAGKYFLPIQSWPVTILVTTRS